MTTAASSRDTIVGGLIVVPVMAWMVYVATEGAGRWPWVGFVILAAAPFLLLFLPGVAGPLRATIAGHPGRALAAMGLLAAYGMVLGTLTGTSRWYNILLWPVCIGCSALAAGTDDGTEISPARLLLASFGIWILAGLWDPQLQVRTPGDLDLGLPYFAALDLAMFLLLVVRPLRTFNPGLGLRGRDIATALAAVAALFVVAVPVGYAVGFLHLSSRWNGLPYGAARLFGLILFVGVPEELLFRGMMQESFSRRFGLRAGWIAASVLFGLTHIVKHAPPLNWRYALLATLAGLAYGWVYRRTGKLAAAAITHGLVDWIWSTFLLVP